MATSRTGTAKYLRNRKRVLAEAKRNGLTNCPGYEDRNGTHRTCGRPLNYDAPLLDESAETDHIVDHQFGGTDDADNLRVLCRACNRARNHDKPAVTIAGAEEFPISRAW